MEYFHYSNIFLEENITELSEHIERNNYISKLNESKKLFFEPIYSLRSIELEILKMYIKINLANAFIQLSKFFAKASIFFD